MANSLIKKVLLLALSGCSQSASNLGIKHNGINEDMQPTTSQAADDDEHSDATSLLNEINTRISYLKDKLSTCKGYASFFETASSRRLKLKQSAPIAQGISSKMKTIIQNNLNCLNEAKNLIKCYPSKMTQEMKKIIRAKIEETNNLNTDELLFTYRNLALETPSQCMRQEHAREWLKEKLQEKQQQAAIESQQQEQKLQETQQQAVTGNQQQKKQNKQKKQKQKKKKK